MILLLNLYGKINECEDELEKILEDTVDVFLLLLY